MGTRSGGGGRAAVAALLKTERPGYLPASFDAQGRYHVFHTTAVGAGTKAPWMDPNQYKSRAALLHAIRTEGLQRSFMGATLTTNPTPYLDLAVWNNPAPIAFQIEYAIPATAVERYVGATLGSLNPGYATSGSATPGADYKIHTVIEPIPGQYIVGVRRY